MGEGLFRGFLNRILQMLARAVPSNSMRVRMHRWRGVQIGVDVWVGYDAVIETAYPYLVSIGDKTEIGIRSLIIAHFRDMDITPGNVTVKIEDEVFIGPGAIILPNVTIGRGAVVTAGSVVTASVPPMTVAQGNPAQPVARCGVPLTNRTPLYVFNRELLPLE